MKLLFLAAHGRLGGSLIRFLFARLGPFLPLRKLLISSELLAFHHPFPAYDPHILIVPRRAVRSTADLTDLELSQLAIGASRAGRQLAGQLGMNSARLVVNSGRFQDIGQVHFHLIPGEEARQGNRAPNDIRKSPKKW